MSYVDIETEDLIKELRKRIKNVELAYCKTEDLVEEIRFRSINKDHAHSLFETIDQKGFIETIFKRFYTVDLIEEISTRTLSESQCKSLLHYIDEDVIIDYLKNESFTFDFNDGFVLFEDYVGNSTLNKWKMETFMNNIDNISLEQLEKIIK